jgi:acylphosphatase
VARQIGVSGWVRNLADGGVEAEAQGTPEQVTGFETQVRRGPAGAEVTGIDVSQVPDLNEPAGGFEIRHEPR